MASEDILDAIGTAVGALAIPGRECSIRQSRNDLRVELPMSGCAPTCLRNTSHGSSQMTPLGFFFGHLEKLVEESGATVKKKDVRADTLQSVSPSVVFFLPCGPCTRLVRFAKADLECRGVGVLALHSRVGLLVWCVRHASGVRWVQWKLFISVFLIRSLTWLCCCF